MKPSRRGLINLDPSHYYRRGGDSLQGRFYLLRLHGLSFAELGMKTREDLKELLKLGGFPEPFFSSEETETKRWSREYRHRLIRENLVNLERIDDLGTLEKLMISTYGERINGSRQRTWWVERTSR